MHLRVKSGRALCRNEFHQAMNLIVRYEHALRANKTRSARRQIKHVALSEQTIRSVLIEDNATVDLRGDLECDSGRNVRLNYAGDHIRARRLRCDDDMNTCRTGHLRDAREIGRASCREGV